MSEKKDKNEISRRDFLTISAFWSCIGAWFLTVIGIIKFPLPALLPDVSSVVKLGKPDDFPVDSSKIFEEDKILVRRDEKGIHAVSLICTHLGCIVGVNENGSFACPCHGSKYNEKGEVTGGPAPKSLNWLQVSQLPNGKLVADRSKFVKEEDRFVV